MRSQIPSAKDYLRLALEHEEAARLRERALHFEKNSDEVMMQDVENVERVARASAPRISRSMPGGQK